MSAEIGTQQLKSSHESHEKPVPSLGSSTWIPFGDPRWSEERKKVDDEPTDATSVVGSRPEFRKDFQFQSEESSKDRSSAQSTSGCGLSTSPIGLYPEPTNERRQKASSSNSNDFQHLSDRQHELLDEQNMVEVLNRIQAIGGVNQLSMLFRIVDFSVPNSLLGTVLCLCNVDENEETASSAVALSMMCHDPWTTIVARLCLQFSRYFDISCSPSLRRAIACEFGNTVPDTLLARVERFFRLSFQHLIDQRTLADEALSAMTSRFLACSRADMSSMINKPLDVSCYLRDGSDFLTILILLVFVCMAVTRATTKPQRH